LLSSHYRQGLDWNDGILHQAKKLLDKIYRVLRDLEDTDVNEDDLKNPPKKIIEALCDDLNTPKVLMELNALLGDISNKTEDEKKNIKIDLLSTGKILGVLQEDPSSWLKIGLAENKADPKVIEKLIESRNKARANKDFKLADSIRDELSSMGIDIEDTSSGTIWKSI